MRPFNSIIVDPQLVNREMVRAAAKAVPELGETIILARLTEAMSEIHNSRIPRDLIFISHRVPEDTIPPFLARLMVNGEASEMALIRVTKGSRDARNEVASGLASGYHGVLCEPFSITGLRDCVDIAVRVKTLSRTDRLRYAISLIYPTYMKRLRQNPNSLITDLSGPEIDELISTSSMLKELVAYSGISYDEIVDDVFDEVEAQSLRAYEGASRRLTERFHLEKTALSSIKAQLLQTL